MAPVRFLWGSFLSLWLVGVVVAAPGAVLPGWRAAFGVTKEVSYFFAALFLGLLIGIWLAQNKGRHPLFPLALLLLALGLALLALAPAFWVVVAAGLVLGVGEGVANVHGNSLVGELFPERRVQLLNRVNVAFGLGAVATPLFLLFLSPRAFFLLSALVALLAAALVWRAPDVGTLRRAGGGRYLPFLLAAFLYTGLEGSLATWGRVHLERLGYGLALGGGLLSLYWGFLALGRLLLAQVVAGAPLVWLERLLLLTLGVLGLVLWPRLAPIFPVAGLFLGPLFATLFALVQARFGHRALGGLLYAGAAGGTLVPALFAYLPKEALPLGFLALALLLFALVSSLRREGPPL
jgi:MFS family permease